MEKIDIGKGDLYIGEKFSYPYFFESYSRKMMEDPSPHNITFKTWKGEFFQFRLGKFHNSKCMILTSTLKDTFFFFSNNPTIAGTMAKGKSGSEKIPIKGSYTGYSSWGGYFQKQLKDLEKHLEEQEIFFTDETTAEIYRELMERRKNYGQKHRNSDT